MLKFAVLPALHLHGEATLVKFAFRIQNVIALTLYIHNEVKHCMHNSRHGPLAFGSKLISRARLESCMLVHCSVGS